MANKLIILICFIFYCGVCNAAPVISTISSASIADNDSISLTGSGFGSNDLDIKWLGGSSGNIESGTSGADVSLPSNWYSDSTTSEQQAPAYSTARAHSGSKSIMCSYPQVSQYISEFGYHATSTFSKLYATWWVYYDRGASPMGGQWKQWRCRPTYTNLNDNCNGEIMRSVWKNADGSHYQAYIMVFCNAADYGQCYEDGTGDSRWTGSEPFDQWYRVEVYLQASSTDGNNDGAVILNIYDQSNTVAVKWNHTALVTRLAGGDSWEYFHFENFFGNDLGDGGDGTSEKIYYDDVYLQMGSRAHVEIGNASTYSSCTHTEIQYPTVYNGTGITFTVNQGSFENGSTAYVFVIDEDGNANATGEAITFGAASEPTQNGKSTLNSNNPKSIITSNNGLTLLK